MGCLNSDQAKGWHNFANIHLSGPCNRSCYFCIGQHMMALDPFNNLDTWPLENLDTFITMCYAHHVQEVNLTGSNTDPLLYKHIPELVDELRFKIPGVRLGLRTNGVLAVKKIDLFRMFDKASISITSFNPEVYKLTMGQGEPPDLDTIMELAPEVELKVNLVLCPELLHGDLYKSLDELAYLGVRKVNLREPYGQPHIGDPLAKRTPKGHLFGMPIYNWKGMSVMYWDVHFVEVESVNLYANGVVSETYPVTLGHHPIFGQVLSQDHFEKSGRQFQQWVS